MVLLAPHISCSRAASHRVHPKSSGAGGTWQGHGVRPGRQASKQQGHRSTAARRLPTHSSGRLQCRFLEVEDGKVVEGKEKVVGGR